MPESMFTKATKAQAKARVAISGPSGSGKTLMALKMARELAEGGKVACIDTERNSASLYADLFDFDTISMSPPYRPDRAVDLIKAAENEGYSALVLDSATHFWNGKGGVLDIVNQAQSRGGNSFTSWAEGTPQQNSLVDAILAFDGHIVVTMRSKTEYVIDKEPGGKSKITKLGTAPIQREGIEYEFTLVADLDLMHNARITKSRCVQLADRTFVPSDHEELSREFINWLKAGDPLISQNQQDTLNQKISTLSEIQKGYLRVLWSEAGLPKVNALTSTKEATAGAIIQRVLTESGAPVVDATTTPTDSTQEQEAFAALDEMSQVES